MPTLMVLGTDTEVGKTRVVSSLFGYLSQKNESVITQKWVQTGQDDDIAVHDQQRCSDDNFPVSDRVPYRFKKPASPHLADTDRCIRFEVIEASLRRLQAAYHWVIVEGTGGVMVPMNEDDLYIDWVKRLDLRVILVVANRVGAINHSLLSVNALNQYGISCLGLVFNQVLADLDQAVLADNPRIISQLTGLPVLGSFGYNQELRSFNWEPCLSVCAL